MSTSTQLNSHNDKIVDRSRSIHYEPSPRWMGKGFNGEIIADSRKTLRV